MVNIYPKRATRLDPPNAHIRIQFHIDHMSLLLI
jgi:hypothetical protein